MKKSIILIILLAGSFYSCKEKDIPTMTESTFCGQLESPPRIDVPKENLPEWLVERISVYEKEPEPPIILLQVYKGEWNKQVVYFLTSIHFSCYFCDVYYENGEQVLLAESDHFCENSKNWVLIYQYGKENY